MFCVHLVPDFPAGIPYPPAHDGGFHKIMAQQADLQQIFLRCGNTEIDEAILDR